MIAVASGAEPASPAREVRQEGALRDLRLDEVAALLRSDIAQAAIALHATPLLLLEPERVRRQYRRLKAALPFVSFHYAVKALSHGAVIEALRDEGCGFDIATSAELALLRGVQRMRIIHTHPIKKSTEIAEAIDAGVRVFVIDNDAELDKFARVPADVSVLVRLAYRSEHAKSDLSSKFGVRAHQARHLVERSLELGIRVAGFSFHVGSQLDDAARFGSAIADTLALMDELELMLGVRFDTLDIGGGFPVGYDSSVASIEEIAAVIRPLLEPHATRLSIIAEPGRVLVAESMTLVTSVVGVSEREDGLWYYLDDGVYGSYSNVIAEDVHPLVFSSRELVQPDADPATHRWATLAGPTCDSTDVIARDVLLPDLTVGDMLVSPAMGAYTAVTATRFNGRETTPIVVITAQSPSGRSSQPAIAQRESVREPAGRELVQTVP